MVRQDAFQVFCVDPGYSTGGITCSFDSEDAMDSLVRRAGPLRAIRAAGAGELGGAGAALHSWEVTDYDRASSYYGRFGEVGLVRDMLPVVWASHLLVVEDFILRRPEKTRDLLSPVRIGSMLEYEWTSYIGRGRVHNDIVWQSSSDKSSWDDEKLKRVGLFQPGRIGGHINDAIRHMCVFLASRIA